MRRLVILGAGGHGRVVADAAGAACPSREILFLDDRYPGLQRVDSWAVVGTLASAASYAIQSCDEFIVAIGDNSKRLELLNKLAAHGAHATGITHPSAWVSERAVLGEGSVVLAGACIGTGAKLGRGVIINTGATVDHDCIIDDGVHVCPGVHLGGNVQVGHRTWIGIGSSVKHSVRIGSDAVIGAGSAVVASVPSGVTAFGVPAKIRLA